jgi:hypothetical protein
MTYTSKYVKLSVAAVLAVASLLLLVAGGAPKQANAAELKCPTFQVMHNDRIGALNLPAGHYNVTVLDGATLSCASASKLFAEFLQDWDGKLRKPWVVNVAASSFTKGKGSTTGFKVSKTGGSSGGGGGSTSASCPGYFQVVHNDSIGSFKVPKGNYRITLIDPNKFTCAKAVKRFQEFLLDYDGVLPKSWRLSKASATFYKPKNPSVGFNINKAYGPSPNPNNNTKFARCPATFQVQHNDRIGALVLPKGPYYIYVGKNSLSCAQASNYFREFLNYPNGKLPSPWKVNAAKARFRGGPGGAVFRVQQA